MTSLKTILALVVIGPLIDAVWIGLIASDFYKNKIGSLLRMSGSSLAPNIPATLAVYVALALLIVFFVLPKVTSENFLTTCLRGLLCGFLVYCFYDMTNLALFKDWGLAVTLVDIAWGTFFVGLMTVIGKYLYIYFS
jgi:uncharacterized membrane protein